MRCLRLFGAVALVAAVIPTSQAASPVSVPQALPDACSLLLREEVRQTTGLAVAAGVVPVRSRMVATCSFAGERGTRIIVTARHIAGWDPWASEQIARMERGVDLGTYREVAGVAGRAFLYLIGRSAVLCTFGRNYYVQVSILQAGNEKTTAAVLRKLASIAGGRLRNPEQGVRISDQ